MILDCCAQQRTYEKFFGLLAGVRDACTPCVHTNVVLILGKLALKGCLFSISPPFPSIQSDRCSFGISALHNECDYFNISVTARVFTELHINLVVLLNKKQATYNFSVSSKNFPDFY